MNSDAGVRKRSHFLSAAHRLSLQEVTEESAEGGSTVAASGAEVATAGASEAAEEETGEDTAPERWTQGQIHSALISPQTFRVQSHEFRVNVQVSLELLAPPP